MHQLFCTDPSDRRGDIRNIAHGLSLGVLLSAPVAALVYMFCVSAGGPNSKTELKLLKYIIPPITISIWIFFAGWGYYHPDQFNGFDLLCRKKKFDFDPQDSNVPTRTNSSINDADASFAAPAAPPERLLSPHTFYSAC